MPPAVVGYSGPGFLFKVSDNTGANITTVALTKDTKGPAQSVDKVDVSTQDMGDRTRRFDPELTDPGTITFDIIYRPENATHAGILAAMANGDMLDFELYNSPPTNTYYMSGSGFFSKFDPTGAVGGVLVVAVEFQVSGAVTQN